MADGKVSFELVTPERLLLSQEADMVVVPGGAGDFGVLPRHAPLISTVRPGTIRLHDGGGDPAEIFVAGGFAEVTPERCTVLAEEAVPLAELDRAEVERELREAREDAADTDDERRRAAAERRAAVAEAKLAELG
ncbi:MAG: F0F1 ATP synthase subunit epsilon [Alphaproteobacteria bacterium]|nr:F0F1 ATP synthase subunit epsilon [Alphaproteobacteria bacterium]